MNSLAETDFGERKALADKLRALKSPVAQEMTEQFLRRHPDWLIRYGETARVRGEEDAAFHLEFLAGAVASGSASSFLDYVQWASGMLASRNIKWEHLAENLAQLAGALAPRLEPQEGTLVTELIEQSCDSATHREPSQVDQASSALRTLQKVFLQTLLQGQKRTAVKLALLALKEGHSVTELYTEVFQESQYALGRLWETNRITVAEEHMATAITQYVMAAIYPHIEPVGPSRGKVLITGVEGEMHQIGANMVADVMEAAGWDVMFLGTNVPTSAVVDAVCKFRPHLIGISTTVLFNVHKVSEVVSSVRDRLGPESPPIILGGAAFRHAPNFPQEIGALGYASDLKEALRLSDSACPLS